MVCSCLIKKEEGHVVVTQQGQTQSLALSYKEISVRLSVCLVFMQVSVVWEADGGGDPFKAPCGQHSRHNIHIIPSQNPSLNRPTSKLTSKSLAIWLLNRN